MIHCASGGKKVEKSFNSLVRMKGRSTIEFSGCSRMAF